ncbi:MAG: cysteine desulfurase [Rhodospirillaceae bacterium]|nr:cysteine desulfurase [Rhodospirillaceae bacterium]
MTDIADHPSNTYDIEKIRSDFPILRTEVHGQPFAFLDSAASAQKPRQVIDAISAVYDSGYANVHRGAYQLSEVVTDNYEGARDKVQEFLNAEYRSEIIFTRNATEAINLVAGSYARSKLNCGDEIIITEMEHHSNIVPWQLLKAEKDLVLKVVPITDAGELRMDVFEKLLSRRTKLVSVPHISNVLGTVLPVKRIIELAHSAGAAVLIDGCQAVMHECVDVQSLDCDFYAFSGHKLYGPSGIGVLYGKKELLDAMPPYMGGGDMINTVTFEESTWAELPAKFEAGTPAIAQAIGLGAAIDYINNIGLVSIAKHENDLLDYTTSRLNAIDGLRIIGTASNKVSVISMILDCAHPHDMATILDRSGVAIRAGHHCAQPLMDRLGLPATARASFGLYNNQNDADQLCQALETVQEIFG